MRPSVLLRADIADCVTGFVGASFFRSAGVDDSELCRECQDEMSGPAGDGAPSGLCSSLFSFGSVIGQLHDQALARLLSRSLVRREMCTHHVQLDSSRKQMM